VGLGDKIALSGLEDGQYTLTLTAADSNSQVASKSISFEIVDYQVELSGDASQSGLVGKTVTYTVAITNTGNTTDTFDLSLSGNSWLSGLSQDSVKLTAGISATVQVTVRIPSEAAYLEKDTVTVSAVSKGNGAQSDTADLTTTALYLYHVSLSGNDGKHAAPGDAVTYTVFITNTGYTTDTFDLSLSGNSWSSGLAQDSITLAAGIGATFQVTVTIPSDATDQQQDAVTVTAISQGDGSQTDTTKLTTTARKDDYEVYVPMIVNRR
jgi:uncharacterized membrane protein